MITPAEFARKVGITRQGVAKAIKVGRIPVYDEAGLRVDASYEGRKFVNPDEAFEAFKLSRARIDDAALVAAAAELERDLAEAIAPPPEDKATTPPAADAFYGARSESEKARLALLNLRLARERGEVVEKAPILSGAEKAGQVCGREFDTFLHLSEQLDALSKTGGVDAIDAFMRKKVAEAKNNAADAIVKSLVDDDTSTRPQ
jgi:hypothetical protein